MNTNLSFKRLIPLAIGAAAIGVTTQAGGVPTLEFEEAQIYFELNDTDGDLGIHGLIDGDAWKTLTIEDPNETVIMQVVARSRLRAQGLTEVFFESDEPTFDELTPAQFFKRFPEGVYEVEGLTLDGIELEGEAELSHTMPAPVGNLKVNGVSINDGCDGPLQSFSLPIRVDWNAVTTSHPDLGNSGESVVVQQYEVVGEIEREGKTPEVLVMSVILPRSRTVFSFPNAFTSLNEGEFKFEIITKLDNGNQTATEACIEIE
jgi:hypothetical protein